MRFDDELDASRFEDFIDALDVVDLVINDRGWMIELRPVGHTQHQTDAATIEEGHAGRRLEQEFHSQHVAIESNRPIQVMHVHEDLPYLRQAGPDWNWGAHKGLSFHAFRVEEQLAIETTNCLIPPACKLYLRAYSAHVENYALFTSDLSNRQDYQIIVVIVSYAFK